MVTTAINLVKLEAEDDKFITDLEKTGTFKSVTCSLGDIGKFIEISAEEAEEIERLNSQISVEEIGDAGEIVET